MKGKKIIAGLLVLVSAWLMAGCGRIPSAAEPWREAYAAFLREPENYAEESHYAGSFALADLNNDGKPEMILVYYNGNEGGAIFANIYAYDGEVRRIGHQVDMWYKTCFLSTNPSFPGVFVEGGRNSTFSCSYWTVKDNVFVDEPLWSNIADVDTQDMVYKELSGNQQLIAEAKKITSSVSNEIEFFEIDEAHIRAEENF